MITAEEYKNLKHKVEQINNRISVLQGKRAAIVSQLKQVLDGYGVSNVTELRTLRANKIAEAEEFAKGVRDYIEKVEPELRKAEELI